MPSAFIVIVTSTHLKPAIKLKLKIKHLRHTYFTFTYQIITNNHHLIIMPKLTVEKVHQVTVTKLLTETLYLTIKLIAIIENH